MTPRKVETSKSHRGKKMHRWELAPQEMMTEWTVGGYIDDPDRPGKLLAVSEKKQVPKRDRWGEIVVAWQKVPYERTKEEQMKKRTIPIKALGPKRLQDLPDAVMKMIAEYSMKGKIDDTQYIHIVYLSICSNCNSFIMQYRQGTRPKFIEHGSRERTPLIKKCYFRFYGYDY